MMQMVEHLKLKYLNPLSANPPKRSNTLKQFFAKLPTNCLSVFDHFVGLVLKGLRNHRSSNHCPTHTFFQIYEKLCGSRYAGLPRNAKLIQFFQKFSLEYDEIFPKPLKKPQISRKLYFLSSKYLRARDVKYDPTASFIYPILTFIYFQTHLEALK